MRADALRVLERQAWPQGLAAVRADMDALLAAGPGPIDLDSVRRALPHLLRRDEASIIAVMGATPEAEGFERVFPQPALVIGRARCLADLGERRSPDRRAHRHAARPGRHRRSHLLRLSLRSRALAHPGPGHPGGNRSHAPRPAGRSRPRDVAASWGRHAHAGRRSAGRGGRRRPAGNRAGPPGQSTARRPALPRRRGPGEACRPRVARFTRIRTALCRRVPTSRVPV